tara:strand:+ start:330 stop:521 length:192 start_codon:yes stop_codon:yes gene_type:complete
MIVTGFKVGDLVVKRNAKKWYIGMLGLVIESPTDKCACVRWSNGDMYLYLNSDLILAAKANEV